MKAAVFHQFGEADVLKVEEVPTPRAREGEAVVKVMSAGINQSDVKNVKGTMHGTTLPRIPGRDFAGVVTEGPAEMVGREVFGTGGDVGFTRDGSHAQFMLVPAGGLTPKPRKLSMDEAGSAGVIFVAAWSLLVVTGDISKEDCVLVVGAGGGVGSAAVQIAVAKGAKIIAAVRSDEEGATARECGAKKIVNTKSENLVEAVRSATDGRGADVLLDASGYMFAECIEAAAMGARVCVIAAPADGKATIDLRSIYRKELRVAGVDTRRLDTVASAKMLAQMTKEFESGAYKNKLGRSYPLADVVEAYVEAARGKERICLRPNE